MSIKTILENLFGRVMKNGKRIPGSRVLVLGNRIFFEQYLLPDNDIIVCTDYTCYLNLRRRGYKRVEFIPEATVKKWMECMEKGKFAKKRREKVYNYIERKYEVKKFDLTVMNPPYDGELHLKIINEFVKHSKRVVAIHPARWMEDAIANQKTQGASGNRYSNLKTMLERAYLIKAKNANNFFHIDGSFDMLIGVYSNSDVNPRLPIYDDSNRFFDVLGKILNYAKNVDSLESKMEKDKITGIRVPLNGMAPIKSNGDCEWYRNRFVDIVGKFAFTNGYVQIGNTQCHWSSAGKKNQGTFKKGVGAVMPKSIEFDSVADGEAFVSMYRGTLIKNIVSMVKYGQGVPFEFIPYFDPKTIKTEDDVLDALGITDTDHRTWLKRKVYDYREKDFIKYGEWIDC